MRVKDLIAKLRGEIPRNFSLDQRSPVPNMAQLAKMTSQLSGSTTSAAADTGKEQEEVKERVEIKINLNSLVPIKEVSETKAANDSNH